MNEALFPYYDRELRFFRQIAPEFAERYPRAADRLRHGVEGSVDPHVERLVQAFALIAGRIHHKLDDEFPELTDALLGVLYPHYLAPIPSMAIIQFDVDPQRDKMPNGFLIDRHSALQTPVVMDDVPCRFRTAYPVRLWPVELTAATFRAAPFPAGLRPPPGTKACLRLQLECQSGLTFADLSLDRLRFYLSGDPPAMATLYELIFNHTRKVVFRPLDGGGRAREPLERRPDDCLFPVGFERDEGLLPYPNRSFLGYRLLTEFFTFPAKFLFVDLAGWRDVAQAGFGAKLEVAIFLDRTHSAVEQEVSPSTFRMGCTPIVNLFEKLAEPIALTHTRHEYQVVPDVAHPLGLEVYSVDSVTSASPGSTVEYQPFYSFRHGWDRSAQQTFWYASRRPSLREGESGADRGTEVFLTLVDLGFDPRVPAEAALIVKTTCTNRDRPLQLAQAGDALPFELRSAAPLRRIACVHRPTAPLRPPLARGGYWRLVSHLSLNHLSLTDAEEGRHALQEILRLYDFSDPEAGQVLGEVTRKIVEGLLALSCRRVVRRVGSGPSGGLARGVEVTVELDENNYVGTGTFLFACVLERFLGLYTSVNSFTQLVARTRQAGAFRTWPPRAGERPIL